ncbi:MAG TPA: ligase-associated DNA damage response endonuclease PdeM [Tepidisphaeraceae bacterium]|jgi:DNA ligase-associated metallophosphoesterase
MIKTVDVTFGGQLFTLTSDRAVYWPAEGTLLLADLHFGKAATFREFGLPVPAGTTAKDLLRLSTLIGFFNPRRLLVLGDLLHAKPAHAVTAQLLDWRQAHARVAIELVVGNHDRHAGRPAAVLDIHVHAEPLIEHGIAFEHEPPADPALPTVAGHIHPTVRLTDFDGSGVRVPCFVVDEKRMIVPAFGSFTGGWNTDRAAGRRLYVSAAGRVVQLK